MELQHLFTLQTIGGFLNGTLQASAIIHHNLISMLLKSYQISEISGYLWVVLLFGTQLPQSPPPWRGRAFEVASMPQWRTISVAPISTPAPRSSVLTKSIGPQEKIIELWPEIPLINVLKKGFKKVNYTWLNKHGCKCLFHWN
jgi:hypothetical protein